MYAIRCRKWCHKYTNIQTHGGLEVAPPPKKKNLNVKRFPQGCILAECRPFQVIIFCFWYAILVEPQHCTVAKKVVHVVQHSSLFHCILQAFARYLISWYNMIMCSTILIDPSPEQNY